MDRPPSHLRRFFAFLGWTRHSSYLLAAFLLICGLIVYVWWPLAQQVLVYINWGGQWWRYFDWLLVGIFSVMSLLIMSCADLRSDALIVFVATIGGLVIEAWGTQTNLWFYFTSERPPLWIVPAWPIATLSIDRITRLLMWLTDQVTTRVLKLSPSSTFVSFVFRFFYWLTFVSFYGLMLYFVAPTFHKTFTLGSLALCAALILTPTDYRKTWLIFLAGAGLGYFLELWGTTRQCWTYYTYQTPPLFAVLAHGMAAVSFWRAGMLVSAILSRLKGFLVMKTRSA
jgi:hypothetical protein